MNEQRRNEIQRKKDVRVFWINLDRAARLRRCMQQALAIGGWADERFSAVDALDERKLFISIPDPLGRISMLPGVGRISESAPLRRTTRPELACLASWQEVILLAYDSVKRSKSGLTLIMEDDAGSSMAIPDAWPFSLEDIAKEADRQALKSGTPWTMVQLAPINARVRARLFDEWKKSSGKKLLVPKTSIRSHGNAAILLHRRAFRHLLSGPFTRIAKKKPDLHLLPHPWSVRPVADKWIYSMVPSRSVYVLTYPLFCLEARDSELHRSHVDTFHRPSRSTTLAIWQSEGMSGLLDAFRRWEETE